MWTLVWDGVLIRNPVLFEAVGVAPLVAMAVSVKTAVILSAVSAAELLAIELLACLLMKRLKSGLRMLLYAALGMAVDLPLCLFFMSFMPNEAASAGIFLPLLAVSSLIALHCERFAVKNTLPDTLADAVSASAGYALVVLIVGAVREILGSGTICGFVLPVPVRLKGLLMPFGGFLLLGFAAAAFRALAHKKSPPARPENAFDLSGLSEPYFAGPKADIKEDSASRGGDREPSLPSRGRRAKKPVRERPAAAARAEKRRTGRLRKKEADGPKGLFAEDRKDCSSEFSEILLDLERYREQKRSEKAGDEKTREDEIGNGGESE